MLDVTNGECVHVDFDCLFDKGLNLARPEVVPFRLTPNMVDAMVRASVSPAGGAQLLLALSATVYVFAFLVQEIFMVIKTV